MESTLKQVTALISQINDLLDGADGPTLSRQLAKLAICFEHLMEGKAAAKRQKYASYMQEFERARSTNGVTESKVIADAKKDMTFDQIESIEAGIRAILSTGKDRLKWIELEQQNKGF